MTYEAFGALLEAKGFQIIDHYGTFASQKDYKHELDGNTKYLYTKLSATIQTILQLYSHRCILAWQETYYGNVLIHKAKTLIKGFRLLEN